MSTNRVPEERRVDDFYFGKEIGTGSFSTVFLAKDKHTGIEYAIKLCEKSHIKRENKIESIKREKEVMIRLKDAPFFVKLFCTFQCENNLYFAMTYCKNSDLLTWIKNVGNFDRQSASFYGAEIICALEYLHSLKIIHRDLKPENILLDEKMHIKITDFGSAKILADNFSEVEVPGRRKSFVGTAQYVSPEVLESLKVTYAADLWAFGCILYQMVSGDFPFNANSEYKIFLLIQKVSYKFPDGFDEDAKDLVKKLLVKDSQCRIGAKDEDGYPSIIQHPFFAHHDFETLHLQEPPKICSYMPQLEDDVRWEETKNPGLGPEIWLDDFSNKDSPKPKQQNGTGLSYLLQLESEEFEKSLKEQEKNPYNKYVEGNLILKQGLLDKTKGLFARRRMFLLTTGPGLYYVDPANNTYKGQVPWSSELNPEPKNFRHFMVHTPNRTYYLEDIHKKSNEWCAAIKTVKDHYFPKEKPATKQPGC